jgi:hypothetical protein
MSILPTVPARAFTARMLHDHLYLIDTQHGTAKSVFDFSTSVVGGWPQLMSHP